MNLNERFPLYHLAVYTAKRAPAVYVRATIPGTRVPGLSLELVMN